MRFSTDEERRIAVIFLEAIKRFYGTPEGQAAYEEWLRRLDQRPLNEIGTGSQSTDITNSNTDASKGRSYIYLHEKLGMPCGRDYFYARYRKFFWLLDKL